MNGPQHYTSAEEFLAQAETLPGVGGPTERFCLAAAQVHATLALAAATAEAAPESPTYGPLVQRPLPKGSAFEGSPDTPGSPWGQVLG